MKAVVIGYFGYVSGKLDGQTVKTRQVHQLLSQKLGTDQVGKFDSERFKSSKLNLVSMLATLARAQTIVYLPGKDSLSYLFPVVYRMAKLLGKKMIYPVVGGWLADFLKERPELLQKVSDLDLVGAETKHLKADLEALGLKNVVMLPNFREDGPQPEVETHTPLRVVYMGRVIPEKGCDKLLAMAQKVKPSKMQFTFYGQVEPDYESEFLRDVEAAPSASYAGVLRPEQVRDALARHDVLALPTRYEGEGFPGSIMDAYRSGLPVVVSPWKDIPEFVEEGVTGFVASPEKMPQIFQRLSEDAELLAKMKKEAYRKSKEFSSEKAWKAMAHIFTQVQ